MTLACRVAGLMGAVEKGPPGFLQRNRRCNIGGNHKFLDELVALQRRPLSHLRDCTGFIQCYQWFRCFSSRGARIFEPTAGYHTRQKEHQSLQATGRLARPLSHCHGPAGLAHM